MELPLLSPRSLQLPNGTHVRSIARTERLSLWGHLLRPGHDGIAQSGGRPSKLCGCGDGDKHLQ